MPLSNYRLMQIASIGGISLVGVAQLMQWYTLDKFKSSLIFKLAVSYVDNCKPLKEIVGDPIVYGKPNLRDRTLNYTTDSEAKFAVPIKGPRTKGIMFIHAKNIIGGESNLVDSKNDSSSSLSSNVSKNIDVDTSWNLVRLEMELNVKPGYRVVIYPPRHYGNANVEVKS